ncbi:MAG TPA: hypothetical protein VNS09_14805 [Solirubrobacter sp.]|nr:hypothetical protein [Solirubrobacter sp.]
MRTVACAAAVVALLLGAPVALAHQGNPHFRSVVTSVDPAVKGVEVSVLNFDDRLLLHNTSGQDITIFDYSDPPKPYAQVLADGTVQVNTNSEAYYLNEDRLGETSVPTDLGSEPNWKELSKSSRFEWHDHRMHWMGKGDPPQLKDKSVRTHIDDWTIPIQIGDQKGQVAGTLTWVPLDEGGLPLGAIFAFAALLIVLSLAVFFVRRRRSGGDGDDDDAERRKQEPVEAW